MLVAGGVAWLAGASLSGAFWTTGTVATLLLLLAQIAVSLRRGEFGLDLIAALAMGGALVLGEHLAGIIVALMFAGGEALEDFAQHRARRELTALLSRMPRTAARHVGEHARGSSLDTLAQGDTVLVRHGEVVPADGTVAAGPAILDESALTGEPLPLRRETGESVLSGSLNAGDPFDLSVCELPEQSTYAGIVRLVREAQEAKAPMARMADRFALVFLPLTLAVAGGAWLLSGDAVRALAVLVVATPCPLILAVPVAIVSGVSRCAGKGVLVKGGGALETMARVRTVLFDKTGTLTGGRAAARRRQGAARLRSLRDPAACRRARPGVEARRGRGAGGSGARARIALTCRAAAKEVAGSGIEGRIGDHDVVVGGWDFVAGRLAPTPFQPDIGSWIRQGRDDRAFSSRSMGRSPALCFSPTRCGRRPATVLRRLRAAGVDRIVLATGDRARRCGRRRRIPRRRRGRQRHAAGGQDRARQGARATAGP